MILAHRSVGCAWVRTTAFSGSPQGYDLQRPKLLSRLEKKVQVFNINMKMWKLKIEDECVQFSVLVKANPKRLNLEYYGEFSL